MQAERRGQDVNYREANRLIEDLVKKYPQSDLVFAARLKQGHLLRKLGQFPQAQQTYETLVNTFATSPDVVLAQLALAETHNAQAARDYLAAGETEHDPLWQLPLWQPYLTYLKSNVADLANAGPSKMAGCMTAALFLQRFVPAGTAWTHVDVYSWNDSERPGKPAGGEAQAGMKQLDNRLRLVSGRGGCKHPDGTARFVASGLDRKSVV